MIVSRLKPAAAAVFVVGLIAGCGSSSSSSSNTASAGSSASASSSASSAPGYGAAAANTTPAAPAAKPIALTTKHNKIGTILAAGSKRMTVYLFEADNGPHSSCSGACATAWPPVIGTASASGGAHASALGTTMRADGTKQVTYDGHPLYYFVKDKDDGDAYGQAVKAFGADWYVLSPSGSKVDES